MSSGAFSFKPLNFISFSRTKLIIMLVLLPLLYLNFMSFVYRYDVGDNLDDKLVSAISSKFIFSKLDGKMEVYQALIKQCEGSKNVHRCTTRYKYRADTLSNYIAPSLLIRLFEFWFANNSDKVDIGEELSLGIFYGYASLFLFACATTLAVNAQINQKSSYVLTFLSVVVLTISNPQILEWHRLSPLFFPVNGSNFVPTIYVPRGAISILLFPITLALLYHKKALLLTLLVFSAFIHTGYAQIFGLFCLLTVTALAVLNDQKYKFLAFWLLVYNIFLALYVYAQITFSGDSIIGFSAENFSLITIFSQINPETIILYLFCCLILFGNRPPILKRATMILLALHGFLLTLDLLTKAGTITYSLSGSNISERMNGTFMYVVITYTFYVIGFELKHTIVTRKDLVTKVLVVTLIMAALSFNIHYIGKGLSRVLTTQYFMLQVNRLKDSHGKFHTVRHDINLFINKNYDDDSNQHWLSGDTGMRRIDSKKLVKLKFIDIDVDDEFLTFLALYKGINMSDP